MNIFLVVLLAVFGVALLMVELFLIPGFGIAGIAGFASLCGAVALAYIKISVTAGHITLVACIVLSAIAVWWILRSNAMDKMALDAQIDGQVKLADNKLQKKQEKEEEDK